MTLIKKLNLQNVVLCFTEQTLLASGLIEWDRTKFLFKTLFDFILIVVDLCVQFDIL